MSRTTTTCTNPSRKEASQSPSKKKFLDSSPSTNAPPTMPSNTSPNKAMITLNLATTSGLRTRTNKIMGTRGNKKQCGGGGFPAKLGFLKEKLYDNIINMRLLKMKVKQTLVWYRARELAD